MLVVYTDGGDTRSAITSSDVADLLKASDVTLSTLGYLEHQSSSCRSAAQMELQRFAAMTGGQAFFPTSLKELDAMYEKIQQGDRPPATSSATPRPTCAPTAPGAPSKSS